MNLVLRTRFSFDHLGILCYFPKNILHDFDPHFDNDLGLQVRYRGVDSFLNHHNRWTKSFSWFWNWFIPKGLNDVTKEPEAALKAQIPKWSLMWQDLSPLKWHNFKIHAQENFSDFLSTLLAFFHVINEKFRPACLLIYLVNKQACK